MRATKEHPCPVCHRSHYCSVSPKGDLVYCTKEPSPEPGTDGNGWMHLIGPKTPGGATNGRVPGLKIGTVTRYAAIDPATGSTIAVHVRRESAGGDKTMWWEMPDGTPKLVGIKLADLPLYGVDDLTAPPGTVVVVTEGEKAADALRALSVPAVGTMTGATSVPSAAVLGYLSSFAVDLWPDNDDAGRRHMARIARTLATLGVTVRTLTWPSAPIKGDAADFVAAGLGRDELNAMHAAAGVPTNGHAAEAFPAGLVEYRMSDLRAEFVQWLWPGRIPFAKMTVLDGDPGLGKSTVTLDIAARLTRGEVMPNGIFGDLEGPQAVMLLTAEDGLRDTVLPRLAALGANLDLVFALESVPNAAGEPEMPAIPRDLAIIEERIRAHDVKLIIVDPLIAFLGDSSETNTWRDQDIRRALGPFGQMLERTGCAALFVRHLNKGSGGNPIYRGGGSIGIIGAVRSGLLVQKDPDDDTGARRIMAPTKANLSAPAKAMAYHMEQAGSGSVRVVWEGETEHTAVGLLAEPLPEDERGALADAVDFLKSELYGNPVLASEIKRRAREADVSYRTLTRARAKLHVQAVRVHGMTGPWSLQLPVLPGTKAAEKVAADA